MADDKSTGGTSEPCGHSYQTFQFWFLSMWLLPVRYAMLLYECGWILYACPAEGFISATNPWVCEHHLVMGFHLQLSPAAQLSSLSYTASFCFLQSHSSLSSLQLAPPHTLRLSHPFSYQWFFHDFSFLSSPEHLYLFFVLSVFILSHEYS